MAQTAVKPEFGELGAQQQASQDRVTGIQFRAMADLLLTGGHVSSRGEVSRELRHRLKLRGLRLHERTIRRHLSGEVTSIPPAVEDAMSELVVERLSLRGPGAISEVLAEAGYDVPSDDERFPLVRSERFMPLVHLWLHLNPGRSKRSLACRLQEDLEEDGLSFVVGSLESLLSGKGMVVRREICRKLLDYLVEHGLTNESAAYRAALGLSDSIEHSLQARELVDAQRFQQLCRAWQIRHHEASARRLSRLLRDRLAERGVEMSLNRLQKSIAGKTRRVRHLLIEAVEALLGDELPRDQSVDDAITRVERSEMQVTDLFWVDAEPIAALAREWLHHNPGSTTRQLAIKVSRTLAEMGYDRGHNAIQPVLGGWKKKTRGFVYRAMLAQFEGIDDPRVPEEHILEPASKLTVAGVLAPEEDDASDGPFVPSALDYLRAMREHAPGAVSGSFVEFAAYRAERLYGVPRDQARAIIEGVEELRAP